MTRPRYPSSEDCPTCNLPRRFAPDVERAVAIHRMEHRRLDHRRSQWRRYKARRDPDYIGAFHDLGCTRERCKCVPALAYSTPRKKVVA